MAEHITKQLPPSYQISQGSSSPPPPRQHNPAIQGTHSNVTGTPYSYVLFQQGMWRTWECHLPGPLQSIRWTVRHYVMFISDSSKSKYMDYQVIYKEWTIENSLYLLLSWNKWCIRFLIFSLYTHILIRVEWPINLSPGMLTMSVSQQDSGLKSNDSQNCDYPSDSVG